MVKDPDTDVVHLVAEFCNGGSVDSQYRTGPITTGRVRRIITEACRGLEHIHSRGLIHRDIKPGNILCHKNGYKIGDFGLASDRVLFGYASANGYLSHLAPEVFTDPATGNRGTTSCKSDIWAMGITTYRLLNGSEFYEHHFNGTDFEDLIPQGGFSLSLPWLPHIPDSWRRFVRKAMHDDTNHRIPTALAMSQALATIPVAPQWECKYTPAQVSWELLDGSRRVSVVWKIRSPRKHEWHAVRKGGGKRDFSAGGCVGEVLFPSQVKAELEDFFANSQ